MSRVDTALTFLAMTSTPWIPVEASIEQILAQYPEPLMALVRGEVPAFVLRQHYNPAHCRALIQRFYELGRASFRAVSTSG